MLGALDLLVALGRDDLRVVRYCSWEGWPPCRPVLLLGGTTSVSSGTDVGESDRIISSWRLLDFHVVSKVSVVDTEVDPPEQNSRAIRLSIASPR
jgi:hypothetical protein